MTASGGFRKVPGGDPRYEHGTQMRYRTGCACGACRAEVSRLQRHYEYARALGRPYTVPVIGSRRRLQALVALGYPPLDLARKLRTSEGQLWKVMTGDGRFVRRSTAERIAAVYRRLENTPGRRPQTAVTARGRGWLPPAAWDGDTIDDPAAGPRTAGDDLADPVIAAVLKRGDLLHDPVAVERYLDANDTSLRLSRADRVHAVRVLRDRGLVPSAIGYRLNMSGARVTALLVALTAAEGGEAAGAA